MRTARMKIKRTILAVVYLSAASTMAAAQSEPISIAKLQTIEQSDMADIPSGCSFVLLDKAKHIVAISTDMPSPGALFWFKAGGKLAQVKGVATRTREAGDISSWRGKFGATEVRIVKGRSEGNRNKPGEDSLHHGKATLEMSGSGPASRAAYFWEAGC
jgi:hypothetical protein